MYAYILDNLNLSVKDVLEFEVYEFKSDIDFENKSSITVSRKPEITDDDFVICKEGNAVIYTGICEHCDGASDRGSYKISLLQIEQLFSRQIFAGDEALIKSSGIEDFVVSEIRNNFINSGDDMIDKSYISVNAKTHTSIAAKVQTENGIYNLKTYLGNIRQYYGIFLEFSFAEAGKLHINIQKKEQKVLPIDTGISDITMYNEVYEVSVLSKLVVCWKVPDKENVPGAETRREFFLLADRTITEKGTGENRAKGMVKSLYVEAETEEEMLQQVYNEFASNSYNHKITFSIIKGSKCYPESCFFIGKRCLIKTQSGVKESMVTGMGIDSGSGLLEVIMGNLKVTLIEKLRRR